ncbi:MAG: hypothetical protein E7641_01755 [Ruminococcaceae bacterium]|nr:hypothetical protein [Oscillospiraceae bacterium]
MRSRFRAGDTLLRRTAAEVKRYRMLMRLIPIAIVCSLIAVAVAYTATVLYTKYGSFTVSVNKLDSVKYALTLSETPDFSEPLSSLASKAGANITNIDGTTLPSDLDMINGEHNGRDYVAYTFYCKNVGSETVTYEYELYIRNMTQEIEDAVRIRLYVDGVPEDFAKTRKDGGGAEPNTTEFYTEKIITKRQISDFSPDEVTKYTVVIWLEGNDPECLDNIIGGVFKIDMVMTIIQPEEAA